MCLGQFSLDEEADQKRRETDRHWSFTRLDFGSRRDRSFDRSPIETIVQLGSTQDFHLCVSIPIGRKLGPSFIKLSNTLKKKIDLARELEDRCVVDGRTTLSVNIRLFIYQQEEKE